MRILRAVKSFLVSIDVFGTNQMLRYKGGGQYQTLTGGIVTFLLVIVFGIIAIQRLISVFNYETVKTNDSKYFLEEPTGISFQIGDSKFIFGVGISNINLNGPLRYFDITYSSSRYSNGNLVQEFFYQLQPCTEQQWANINQVGKRSYHEVELKTYLCPKPYQLIQLKGKFTSESFKIQKIKIKRCKNGAGLRPCVSDEVLKTIPSFNLRFYYMNIFVNSGNLEPIEYYLEDRNYFYFKINDTISSTNNFYFSQHVINTDKSLLPNEKYQSQNIILINEPAQIKGNDVKVDEYASIVLRKSPQYIESNRKFEKFDETFSFIGGLFGFVITFFFLVSSYTQAAYEVDMGNQLFHYDSDDALEANKFNFMTYLCFRVHSFFKGIGINWSWKKIERYQDCKQETCQQMDLALLINKITFLQKCMNVLLEEHQFRSIYLQQKPSVQVAKTQRVNHGINKFIHKQSTLKRLHNKEKKKEGKGKSEKVDSTDHNFMITQIIERDKEHNHDEKLPKDMLQMVKTFILKEINGSVEGSSILPQSQILSKQRNLEEAEVSPKREASDEQNQDINFSSLRHINSVMSDIDLIKKESDKGNPISRKIYQKLANEMSTEKLLLLKSIENLSRKMIDNLESAEMKKENEPMKKEEAQSNFMSRLKQGLEKYRDEEKKVEGQVGYETNGRFDNRQYP